ncbi:MAG: hypothetical protein SGARI_005940 [Bacillariaceae sp.]
MSITSCFYVFVRPIPEEGQPELPREGFGYISRQIGVNEPPAYRQCAWYDASEKAEFFQGDGMWNAGKAMSILAAGVGFVVMCITVCTCCVAFELPTFDGLFWTCLLCFIAQALTFLAWGSELCEEYECTWSSGTGMNITAAMLWVWAANMIKSFPEALPPRGRRKNRRSEAGDTETEDSPYLTNNRNGFQDEYNDGDEFNDWGGDGENGDNANKEGYYDENGDWHEPEEPQGYYDDDGNWYDYNNQNNETDDGSGYYDDGNASYYTDGEDPLAPQPQSYYGENSTASNGYDDPQPNVDDGYTYDYGNGNDNGMSQEEMEFMSVSESQRSINQMD